MPTQRTQQVSGGDPGTRFFNVIFHGPFVFVFYPKRLEVLAPETDEHQFGVGNWKSEKPCQPGTYWVKGVSPSNTSDTVDQNCHAIIDAGDVGKIATEAYYQFVLPTPKSITALGRFTPRWTPHFIGDYSSEIKAQEFGSAHAITYQLGANDSPRIENFQWEPKPNPLNAINLHVFAESPFLLDDFHPNRDFAKLVELVPRLSLGLARPFPDIDFKLAAGQGIGVPNEEQGGLRGIPVKYVEMLPPRICDAPSLVVTGATDSV
jgi:hypothetical protein